MAELIVPSWNILDKVTRAIDHILLICSTKAADIRKPTKHEEVQLFQMKNIIQVYMWYSSNNWRKKSDCIIL